MSKAKKKTELKMTNEKNTIRDGPADVKGALAKLKKCKGACTREKQSLQRAKAKSCGNKKNKDTTACKNAANALKKGKYKFHPVYGYLRY